MRGPRYGLGLFLIKLLGSLLHLSLFRHRDGDSDRRIAVTVTLNAAYHHKYGDAESMRGRCPRPPVMDLFLITLLRLRGSESLFGLFFGKFVRFDNRRLINSQN